MLDWEYKRQIEGGKSIGLSKENEVESNSHTIEPELERLRRGPVWRK